MAYYKEEELLKVTKITDAWGAEEIFVTWEEHDVKRVNDYYLGLCMNCLRFFLRRQKCNDWGGGCLMLSQNAANEDILKNNADQYNKYAPKVAYGIVAWLLRYTYYDDELGCLSAKESLDTILNRYREECYKRWQYQNQKKYLHYSVVTPSQAEIDKLDKSFLSQHIEQEREYINTLSRPTFIVDAHYTALLKLCKDHLNHTTIKQQSEPQEEQDLECLFPTLPNWNYSNMLDEFKKLRRRNGSSIVDESLTTDRFIQHIKSADVSFIRGEKVKGYKIAFIRQASQSLVSSWRDVAMRKANLTQKEIESYPLTENQKKVFTLIYKHT